MNTNAREQINNLRVDAADFLLGEFICSFDDTYTIERKYLVFVNGVYTLKTDVKSFVLHNMQPGTVKEVSILPVSDFEYKSLDVINADIFYYPEVGSSIKLEWDKLTGNINSFASYRIYMDGYGYGYGYGYGFDELTDNAGIDNTSLFITDLEEGREYFFMVSSVDVYDNESGTSSPVSIIANTAPEEVEERDLEFDEETQCVTFQFTAPAVQDTDCVGYAIYNNYDALSGTLLNNIQFGKENRLSFTRGSASYTSYPLFQPTEDAAVWRWCVRAVDKSGIESPYEEIQCVILDGEKILDVPIAPVSITAEPIEDGKIRITVYLSDPDGFLAVRAYAAPHAAFSSDPTGDTTYVFETLATTESREFDCYALLANGTSLSAETEHITIFNVVDKLGVPTGLKAKLI